MNDSTVCKDTSGFQLYSPFLHAAVPFRQVSFLHTSTHRTHTHTLLIRGCVVHSSRRYSIPVIILSHLSFLSFVTHGNFPSQSYADEYRNQMSSLLFTSPSANNIDASIMHSKQETFPSTSSSGGNVTPITASASAPGKLILFGEHAVVYHQPAVCGALSDLRIYVTCAQTLHHGEKVCIHMPDLDILFFATISSICLQQQTQTNSEENTNSESNDDELYQDQILQILRQEQYKLDDFAVQALSPVIYLVNKLLVSPMGASPSLRGSGIHMVVQSSSLVVGAGLGSSAAFSVAIAAALIKFSLLLEKEKKNDSLSSAELPLLGRPPVHLLHKINHYAYQAERINHGTPSGLDNTVSVYGGIIYFYKKKDIDAIECEELFVNAKIRVLLTNTGIPRSTKKMVQHFRTFKQAYPDISQGILNSCGAISKTFYDMLKSITPTIATTTDTDETIHSQQQEQQLDPTFMSILIETNQSLLRAMGVSHPSLERICEITKQQYNLSTKLTGAGGGGCAYTYLPDNFHDTDQMIQVLESSQHGVTCIESKVGGSGVLWVEPSGKNQQEQEEQQNPKKNKKQQIKTSLLIAAAAATSASIVCGMVVMSRRRR